MLPEHAIPNADAPETALPGAVSLRLRRLPIDTYNEAVAYLPRRSSVYRPEEFQALEKVELRSDDRVLLAVLNVVDHEDMLGPDEVGLSNIAFARFGVAEGANVTLVQAAPPQSLDAVRRKIDGEQLTAAELDAIIGDVAAMRYSKMELAAFLISAAGSLSNEELLNLTLAMIKVGVRLSWDEDLVVDKHCVGGLPGNRTSLIVVPIVAAHGLAIPKTSSRAITSPAGTADTMEVLARVDLSLDEMAEMIRAERGFIAWGGRVKMSPADDVLISVERPLRLDTPQQMVASIMSKKCAAGSTQLLIDIPVGPTAKVRSRSDAVRLRKLFEFVGRHLGIGIEVEFTDGSQPIGRGIGPALEARDAMQVLACKRSAPADLRERAIRLAGRVLDFDPALPGGMGAQRARDLLDSGAALKKMERIIARQGRQPGTPALGTLIHDVVAPSDGVVTAIDCFEIARVARLAGAPNDKGAGVDLFKKIGDTVEQGEPLFRIHANLHADLRFAVARASSGSVVTLGERRRAEQTGN